MKSRPNRSSYRRLASGFADTGSRGNVDDSAEKATIRWSKRVEEEEKDEETEEEGERYDVLSRVTMK